MRERWKLTSKRLAFRELDESDWPDVCRMLQDPAVMYAWEHPFSDEEVRLWLPRQIARYGVYEHLYGLWGVVRKEDGRLIGQMGITRQDAGGYNVFEIGYILEKESWHQGYAAEAVQALRDYAFAVMDVREVYSIIRTNNTASLMTARRNGMKQVKTMVRHYYGIDMPHAVYRITRQEWDALRKEKASLIP